MESAQALESSAIVATERALRGHMIGVEARKRCMARPPLLIGTDDYSSGPGARRPRLRVASKGEFRRRGGGSFVRGRAGGGRGRFARGRVVSLCILAPRRACGHNIFFASRTTPWEWRSPAGFCSGDKRRLRLSLPRPLQNARDVEPFTFSCRSGVKRKPTWSTGQILHRTRSHQIAPKSVFDLMGPVEDSILRDAPNREGGSDPPAGNLFLRYRETKILGGGESRRKTLPWHKISYATNVLGSTNEGPAVWASPQRSSLTNSWPKSYLSNEQKHRAPCYSLTNSRRTVTRVKTEIKKGGGLCLCRTQRSLHARPTPLRRFARGIRMQSYARSLVTFAVGTISASVDWVVWTLCSSCECARDVHIVFAQRFHGVCEWQFSGKSGCVAFANGCFRQ